MIKIILDDPAKAKLPKKLGDQYALISYLCSLASEKKARKAAGKLLSRFPAELALLLARDMLRANPIFTSEKGYLEFVSEHRDLLV